MFVLLVIFGYYWLANLLIRHFVYVVSRYIPQSFFSLFKVYTFIVNMAEETVFIAGEEGNDRVGELNYRKRSRPASSDIEVQTDLEKSELSELREEIRVLSSKIQNVLGVVGNVSSEISRVSSSVDQILVKLNVHDRKIDEMTVKLDNNSAELSVTKNTVKQMESKLKDTESKMRDMEWRIVDQEARSRRNNLLFFGVPEKEREVCADVIDDVIKKDLKLGNKRFPIQRAHRLGAPKRPGTISRPRPIIVNFVDYKDKEEIRSARQNLRRPMGIGEDFPIEVRKAGPQLPPTGPRARSSLRAPLGLPGPRITLQPFPTTRPQHTYRISMALF